MLSPNMVTLQGTAVGTSTYDFSQSSIQLTAMLNAYISSMRWLIKE